MKKIFLLTVLFTIFSCGTIQNNVPSQVYDVLNAHIMHYSQGKTFKLYYKSYDMLTKNNWGKYLNFKLFKHHISSDPNLNFKTILTNRDIKHMQNQILKDSVYQWNKKFLPALVKLKKNKKRATWFITKPIFSLNKKYAFLYSIKNGSSEIVAYQKTNGKWEWLAVIPISFI